MRPHIVFERPKEEKGKKPKAKIFNIEKGFVLIKEAAVPEIFFTTSAVGREQVV